MGKICAATLIVAATVCLAQTPGQGQHRAKKAAKPEPTELDLFNYVRGKLLALSPSDGINDNVEVAFDQENYVLTITQPDGRCEIFLGAIDANTAIWEAFDPSDSYHTREDVLRLTMTSLSGRKARVCYDNQNLLDTSIPTNRVRLLFSMSKANAVPKFTDKMITAMKKLVALAGGNADKDPI
jgi:hypothetical protein